MKTASKLGHRILAATIWRRLITVASGPANAIAYCRAAQRDEENGYPFTAATEWGKAAQLLAPIPVAAELCWQQWERITRLPHLLSQPIADSAPGTLVAVTFPRSSMSQTLQVGNLIERTK